MDSKILELAKKLYALHQQGVGGEKLNATQKLEQLMQRYSITLDMLDESHKSENAIEIKKDQEKFLIQIVAHVLGKTARVEEYRYAKRGHKRFCIHATPAEFIEIRAKFDFYWDRLEEEKQLFYEAFIHKNRLGVYSPESEGKELTDEEAARLFKISQMMGGMDKHEFRKQIEK